MRKLPGPAGTSKDQDGAVTAEDNSEIRDQKVDCFASVSFPLYHIGAVVTF
jgi:hypothetical protein